MTTNNKKVDDWGIRTPEQTQLDFPVGTVVVFVRYDDHVHGVGFEPGDRLEVVGYSTDCGNDGLRVRRIADSVSDLVFSTEVRIATTPDSASEIEDFDAYAGAVCASCYYEGKSTALFSLASSGSLELIPGEGLGRIHREVLDAIHRAEEEAVRSAAEAECAAADGCDEEAQDFLIEARQADRDVETMLHFAGWLEERIETDRAITKMAQKAGRS